MTTLETLKAARAVIEDPNKWAQEEYAYTTKEDGSKRWVRPNSPAATCWCAVGAISRVINTDTYSERCGYIDESYFIPFGMGQSSVEAFNDLHTHAQVIALFDKAIAKLEGGGK